MEKREFERQTAIERSIIKKYEKTIWQRFIGACKDYKLIEAGDKIAVCISGGKDSFLLAKCMQQLKKHSDVPFELEFICMDPGYKPENRDLIIQNAQQMGIPLHVFDSEIFASVDNIDKNPCYLCARMRRGYLYKNAQMLGCNKIALGHHFDDVIETTLMSMLWGAEIKTMPPKLKSQNYSGMQLIRPLYLVREEDVISWRKYNDLTFLACACRMTERNPAKENAGARAATKRLLKQLRLENPQVDVRIFRSMENVNLNTVLGYTKDGEKHSFLEGFT
ncbi:MAG: tRNA 2-thiocytidine biosynthesis protein TtcA [Clostridia bacterium]|nr:tRNA 2-thiocytidine biosynthesis protein TtcA [Clostridia bacterium]